jgi:hypothetical protein
MESHTCDNKKKKNPKKFLAFQRGQIMTLAAASVINIMIILSTNSKKQFWPT